MGGGLRGSSGDQQGCAKGRILPRHPLPARHRTTALPHSGAPAVVALQRSAGNRAVSRHLAGPPVTVQRHAGFRTKPRLEVPELDPLPLAASFIKRFDLAKPVSTAVRRRLHHRPDRSDRRGGRQRHLRMERAFQVSDFLHSNGVPGARRSAGRSVERLHAARTLPGPRRRGPAEAGTETAQGAVRPQATTESEGSLQGHSMADRGKAVGPDAPKLPTGVTRLVLFAELTMIRTNQPPRTADLAFAGGGQGLSTRVPPRTTCGSAVLTPAGAL